MFHNGSASDLEVTANELLKWDLHSFLTHKRTSVPKTALEEQNYIFLKEEDIRQHQEDDIMRVAGVLSIPRVAAITLLRHYN